MKNIKIKKQNKWTESPLVAVLLFIVLVFLIVSLVRTYGGYQTARNRYIEQERELEQLRIQEAELAEDLEFMQTERGREELIRMQHPVAKEGEELIIIISPEDEE